MNKFLIYILPIFSVLIGHIGQVIGCGEHCTSCASSNNLCQNCKTGYWLHNYECKKCPDNCKKCTNYQNCSECKTDFWGKGACNSKCPENCDGSGCDYITGECYKCQPWFYGTSCQKNCSLCNYGLCERHDGQCLNGCKDGYYEDSYNDIKTCNKCQEHCNLCYAQGNCSECDKGFYAKKYDSKPGNTLIYCFACLHMCEECKTDNNCTICPPGLYGPSCQDSCNESYCHRCDGIKKCTECVAGYILNETVCVQEVTCSKYCAYSCDENHMCVGGCRDGWSGQNCTEPCTSQCQACKQNNKTVCTRCKGAAFTSLCNSPCSANCSVLSSKDTCRLQDGFCLNGCTDGHWGDKCDKSCQYGCNSTQCNQTNGSCETCHRNYYGPACKNICSKNCIDNGNSSYICLKVNGTCSFGCKDGYIGDKCEQATTTQKSATANIVPATPTQKAEENTNIPKGPDLQTGAIIGAGAGGGVVILAIVVVVVVFVIVKRNRRKRTELVNDDEYQNKQQQLTSLNIDNTNDMTDHNVESDDMAEDTNLDEIMLENLDDDPHGCIVTELNIPDSDTYYNMEGLIRSRVQIANLLEYIRNKAEFESEFEKLPQGLVRTCNEALQPQNRVKNRYNGIYAYDATRVVLQSQNYINANYIEGYSQSGVSYIASLGPTKATMNNDFSIFWEMVWQEKTNKIIMLTNLEESDKMKCQQYWPDQRGHLVCGDFNIRRTAEKVYSDFVVRELTIEKKSVTRKVTHYHYTAWPDKTVPDTVASLIEFRDKVEQDQTPITGPMIVHCSAGIGRTGTYISLDILMREGKKENSVDIFGCVNAIRGQRVNLVQTLEQYVYIHKCVLYALTCDVDPLPVTDIPRVMTDEKVTAQFKAFENMESLSDSLFPVSSLGGGAIMHADYIVPHTRRNGHCIDAVYLNGYVKRNKFIATETPSSKTMEDFLSLLLREKCPCVVSLDDQTKTDKSVADYVPPANKVSTFGHFKVECLGSDSKNAFTLRQLKISRTGSPATEDLKINHYQVNGWSRSDSVPDTAQSFLAIIVDVEKTRANEQSDMPVAVHCKTGTERSSLFCVVSTLMEKAGVEKELSVINTVCQVRSRRRNAIKDTEQMQFCYDCVTEM